MNPRAPGSSRLHGGQKGLLQAKEADETQEALSEKIANLKKQKKFYLAMLEFRNKHATLNKATEFRYVGKQGRKYYVEFRQAAGEHITKLTLTQAREWFNYDYLGTAFKFDGWVPLEDTFSHFKAQWNEDAKEIEYTVFKDNGIGIPVPNRWVYHFFNRDFINKCMSRDNLDKKVPIPVGAAARSGSVSRTAALLSAARPLRLSRSPEWCGTLPKLQTVPGVGWAL